MEKPKTIYEKVKTYLEWSNNFQKVRDIAIELLDGNSYEQVYENYKDEIDDFFNKE